MNREISKKWNSLQEHVADICQVNGRSLDEVKIIAVSKFQPEEAIREAWEAGCSSFGENRVQEALLKIESLKPLKISWHFIGTLQKNKVSKVIGKFSLIHSVDDHELALKISEESQKQNIKTSILLQVNLTEEKSKHGFSKNGIREHLFPLMELKGIAIQGLMTIGPLSDDSETIRRCFKELKDLRDILRQDLGDEQALPHLSMGMTNDYPLAIAEGATLLRIGSALFGTRGQK